MNSYQKFIALSRYARWVDENNRREFWDETADRYMDFMQDTLKEKNNFDLRESGYFDKLRSAIIDLGVMPSMRCLMTAGKALKRDNAAGFNCSYVAVDNPRAFSEIIYILMCGSGVGFSVERQVICDLPEVPKTLDEISETIVVKDNRIGWTESFERLITLLYEGKIPRWDLSKIRASGTPLKTFGGRASGPAPLDDLFRFTIEVFKEAGGRKLNSLEVHDIVCKIGDIVVVGGVRRSALISLSNLSDDRMRHAKSGEWWKDHPHRALANNSAAYSERPESGRFMAEWLALYESKSGERGIFNRAAADLQVSKLKRRKKGYEWGCNPCSEIILRSCQFCNLSEVIIRPQDDATSLKEKVVLATIFGTMQATLTDYSYLRDTWKKNTEEEALLGVSLTGIMDNTLTAAMDNPKATAELLREMKAVAVETNREWAGKLGIKQAAAVTCVKPSGTVSQLCDTASGIHPRYSRYYLRRVRMDKSDPLATYMIEQGFPFEEELMHPDRVLVFSFPMKVPDSAIVQEDLSAIQHLEIWKIYQDNWCEHKPSATITVRESEWMEVGAWVFKNFDAVSGVSFLPHSGHTYRQAPYETISEFSYTSELKKMPKDVSWKMDETSDQTIATRELACSAGACEL